MEPKPSVIKCTNSSIMEIPVTISELSSGILATDCRTPRIFFPMADMAIQSSVPMIVAIRAADVVRSSEVRTASSTSSF